MKTPDHVRVKKTTGKMQIATPGDVSYLAYIRAIITDLARQVGFPETEVAKIEMAVDEACSNVLEHAYARDKQWRWQHREPEIRLSIRTEAGRLVIEINDHGQSFDFDQYQPANLEHRVAQMAPGGYGIHIMRKFMDEVQYSSNDQTGNTLRLVKYLKKT
jgi:serine/threonine-protein kinase RsbW